jgi:uncharacterized protein
VTALSLIPVFMIGLLGSVHCIGMCGGIVSALSVTPATRKPFPIAVVAGGSGARAAMQPDVLRVAAYNTGRIGSYMVAGAIAGGIAQSVRTLSTVSTLQVGGYWLANLMLIALGLYLMDAWRGLAQLESAGQLIWRHVQPLMKRLPPGDTPARMLALGALWGWVPCGMVYSVLLTAMLTGSALSGASVMLAFGAGTLPMLLTLGLLGGRLRQQIRRPGVRTASGLVIIAFGLLGLMRAANGLSLGWLDAVCITPGVH